MATQNVTCNCGITHTLTVHPPESKTGFREVKFYCNNCLETIFVRSLSDNLISYSPTLNYL